MKSLLGLLPLLWTGACHAVVAAGCNLAAQSTTFRAGEAWPFHFVWIDASWPSLCTNFSCVSPPAYVGASISVAGAVIAIDIYGSDDGLPANVTVAGKPTLSDPRPVVQLASPQLAAGTYSVQTTVHEVSSGAVSDLCSAPSGQVSIDDITARVEKRTAVEFYNPTLDHYFVSADQREIADLDLGRHPGWMRTGLSFTVLAPGESGGLGRPVCRYYGLPSAGLDSHFYSANAPECAGIPAAFHDAWQLEADDVFEVRLPDASGCPMGFAPVYRLWNQRADSNHRYTTQPDVVQQMEQQGYVVEGWNSGPYAPVAMCVPA
jgi:hypothetical protein